MKKILLFILFCVNINYFCFAQSGKRNKVETLYIAYLTKQLALTADEAKQFWPVYQNYRSEIKSARQLQKDELDWEEETLNIRKKYRPEFKKILVDEQRVSRVYKAERNFRLMLRKEQLRRQSDRIKPANKNSKNY